MKPKSLLVGLTIVLALAVFLLLLPTSPCAAGMQDPGPGIQNPESKIQNQTVGSDILLSAHTYDDFDPAIAYNAPAGEFLAVWRNGSRIVGQRYLASGQPLGEMFYVGEAAATQAYPSVAYSLNGDRYLVAWEDNRNGDYDIYGQLVDAGGTLIDDNSSIYVGDGNQQRPDVASDGTGFLVVWHGNYWDDSTEVMGRLIDSSGSAGTLISIATDGGASRRYPAVAYNPWAPSGEYLVVFEYGDGASAVIRARRVSAAGGLPGAEYAVSSQPMAEQPDLAAGPWGATGGYVVVWDDNHDGDFDIYGRVVLAGSDGSFDGDPFSVDSGPDLQHRAAIARAPASGRYLVTWTDARTYDTSDYDIYARHLTDDANLSGPSLPVSDAAGWQSEAAVAGGDSPDAYFLAWADDRLDVADIHGQRIAASGSFLSYEFTISAQPEIQRRPDVAYDHESNQYLAVWEDNRDGHWDIYGQRLDMNGQPLERPWPIEADGHDNSLPAVAFSGQAHIFVVVWYDAQLDKLEGRHVPQAGTATTLFSVTDSDGGYNPSLAYEGDTGNFLVAWDHNGDIYARPLGANGFPLAGPSLLVAGGASYQAWPRLAVDTDRNQFLIIWVDDDQIYGRLADHDGSLIGDAFQIAGGDGAPRFNGTAAYQLSTKETGRGGGGEYLVVYEHLWGEADVYGRLLNPDGSPIGAEFIIREEPDPLNNYDPQVVYGRGLDLFYVVWSEDTGGTNGYEIYGQWLAPDGAPASALMPCFSYPENQYDPRVAYDHERQQGLVVWNDNRRGAQGDIYARLGAVDTTPPTALFTRDPTAGRLGDAFTLDARASTDNLTPPGALAVRWDWTSDGDWDTAWSLEKVAVVTPAAQGVYTITLQVHDLMWLTDTVSLPIWVLPATANTPPTADLTVTPLFAQAGTQFQFDASGSSDAETPAPDLVVRWDWENDGAWDTGWSTTKVHGHIYTESGLRLARVDVRDGGLLTDAALQLVLVLPAAPVDLEVSPPGPKLLPGTACQFHATAWDSYGNEMRNPPVTWSVADPLVGTIDASGLFTASLRGGLYEDVVVATWGALSDAVPVMIAYPYSFHLPVVIRNY